MQVTIDVVVITEDGLTTIVAKRDDTVIRSTILSPEITNIDDLAAWLLAQRGRQRTTDTDLQKRLTIDYHVDNDQTIIDSVVSEPLPADSGRSQFVSLPGWSDWTASEAESWIETNVTDLASAKTALKAMAKAIIYLRNVAID